MDLFIQLDVDLLAFVILLAMFINTRKSLGIRNKSTDLFSRLTFLMLISTFVEIVTFAIDGRPGSWMYAAGFISNSLLFALAPVTLYLWVDYIEHLFVKDLEVCRFRVALRGALVAVIMLMVLANFYTGILFQIEEGNVYVRGPWFVTQVMLNILIAGQAYLTLLLKRRSLNPVMLWSLVLFPLLPVAGVVIQTLFYGTTATLSFKTVALLLIYINVQRAMIFIDPLTGLENRRSIDLLVKAMGECRREVIYAGVMLDIDNLKGINDLYGHSAGDLAIKRTAELLRGSLRKTDFVARYAGDEFLVVMEVEDRMALLKAVERIQGSFAVYNETSGDPWKLEVSMGYDTFVYKTPEEVEQALREIDLKMYEEKNRRKIEKKSNLNVVSV
ncbi:MAG: diguanylate cyclase [Acidaminobacter sp.]|uniref:GGDEF domain-containing protein n=1 Tax=Acidaminobacter sp. TaxID=1872102 RepID=UPI0013850E0F|nr:GGDEF domain-containing protein [Acidaminobacter sp.]MZQ96052.1 diguanylate cyclase [Acidaminobacter sp.]